MELCYKYFPVLGEQFSFYPPNDGKTMEEERYLFDFVHRIEVMIWNYSFCAKCFITQDCYSCFAFSFQHNHVLLIKNTSVTRSTFMVPHQMK